MALITALLFLSSLFSLVFIKTFIPIFKSPPFYILYVSRVCFLFTTLNPLVNIIL